MGQLISVEFDSLENVRRRAQANRDKDADQYRNTEPQHPGYRRGFLLLIREWWRLWREWRNS